MRLIVVCEGTFQVDEVIEILPKRVYVQHPLKIFREHLEHHAKSSIRLLNSFLSKNQQSTTSTIQEKAMTTKSLTDNTCT